MPYCAENKDTCPFAFVWLPLALHNRTLCLNQLSAPRDRYFRRHAPISLRRKVFEALAARSLTTEYSHGLEPALVCPGPPIPAKEVLPLGSYFQFASQRCALGSLRSAPSKVIGFVFSECPTPQRVRCAPPNSRVVILVSQKTPFLRLPLCLSPSLRPLASCFQPRRHYRNWLRFAESWLSAS